MRSAEPQDYHFKLGLRPAYTSGSENLQAVRAADDQAHQVICPCYDRQKNRELCIPIFHISIYALLSQGWCIATIGYALSLKNTEEHKCVTSNVRVLEVLVCDLFDLANARQAAIDSLLVVI